MDAIFPTKVETQCLTKEQYANYTCPKAVPHKCEFKHQTVAHPDKPESQAVDALNPQLFGRCPSWVGHSKKSGLCDFTKHVGACYALMDAILPFKIDTQCLTKEQYSSYKCPKTVPHKCEFHSEASATPQEAKEEIMDTMNAEFLGHCPRWVGHDKLSGLCDFQIHEGACYARKDAIFPLKVETQCLTKDQYAAYKCPEVTPHKCKFHNGAESTEPASVLDETNNLRSHCPHWVGHDKISGLCNFNVHVGACFARMDAIFPTKVETQCLTKEQYANYTCPKAVPHKCEFKQQAITIPEKAESQAVDALRSHCPRWVGRDKRSGLCILTVHKGACYAITDAIFPTKIETQCLLPDQYNAYKCPKSVPHKCEFHDSGSEMQAASGNKTSSRQEVQFLI